MLHHHHSYYYISSNHCHTTPHLYHRSSSNICYAIPLIITIHLIFINYYTTSPPLSSVLIQPLLCHPHPYHQSHSSLWYATPTLVQPLFTILIISLHPAHVTLLPTTLCYQLLYKTLCSTFLGTRTRKNGKGRRKGMLLLIFKAK